MTDTPFLPQTANADFPVTGMTFWTTGLEEKIPAKANVDYVGEYQPTFFGFGKFKPGVKPADLELK